MAPVAPPPSLNSAPAAAAESARQLRSAVQALGAVQKHRIAMEQAIAASLRACGVIQRAEELSSSTCTTLLAIAAGQRQDGTLSMLGELYDRALEEELRLARHIEQLVADHPAWPWLVQVKGIGPRLAARLLSRLDLSRASGPSAFWAYCGLDTVPATRYRCSTCLADILIAASREQPRRHRTPEGKLCDAPVESHPDAGEFRVARPPATRGERRAYDAYAKATCYLIGESFARQGGKYKALYRETYARLEKAHPEWPRGRVRQAASRATVKRFLTHLWLVWRDATISQSEVRCVTPIERVHDPGSPWEMVDELSRSKLRARVRGATGAHS